MKKYIKSVGTFIRSFPSFIVFELIFKLILTAVGAPVLTLLLRATMKISGINYLSDESMTMYLKNPVTLVVVVILLFVSAFFSFVELSALTGCFACYRNGKRISVEGMFRTGLRTFKKAFRGTGILKFMCFMVIMPFVALTISSGVFMAPLMPILNTVFRSAGTVGSIAAFVLIQFIFVIIIMTKSYTMHFLVLTDKSFSESVSESKKLIVKKKWKMILSFVLWALLLTAFISLVTFTLTFLIYIIIKNDRTPYKAFSVALRALKYAGRIFTAVSAFVSAPAVMCWLTECFSADTENTEKIKCPDFSGSKVKPLVRLIAVVTSVVIAGFLNITYIKALYEGNVSLNVGILTKTQVSAHRGFSRAAPENTLYAFEAAMDSGADFIELDVQLTKDNELVVFHDETINRTTNGKGYLSDYTYDALMQFSAGSWFNNTGEFDDAFIPKLSEVLELVGDEKMLNIEIKDHGDVKLTAEKTVELIEEYGIESSCVVTSFSYAALKKVKQLNPKIKTGLIANAVTSVALTKLKFIDVLSLNHLLVNRTVVSAAHQNGKRIFVWTVDKSSEMEKLIAMGVDNIITNRPDKAVEIIYSDKIGDKVLNILKTIFKS